MASGYEVVDEGHVGDQGQFPSEWKTIRVVFHNFADLPSNRGDNTESPVLKCHGLEWQVRLYPGGDDSSSKNYAFVSMCLCSMSTTDTNKIRAKKRIRVPSAGKAAKGKTLTYDNEHPIWGHRNFAKREIVLNASKNYLVGGNLAVEVDIQVMLGEPPAWTPTNTVCSDMLKVLDSADAETADVSFQVGDSDNAANGATKNACELFFAHSLVLSARAPDLAALADDCGPGTTIPISVVRPDLFRMLLRFVYGGELPGKDVLKGEARVLIKTADRFGCTDLKLAVEAEMAAAGITTENAAELILFADATNLALLKEAAMDHFVLNAQHVMASEGFEQVTESSAVMADIMAAMASGSKRLALPDVDGGEDYKRMRVATLRHKLDAKGLDVDGSKEMLISRLEEAEAEGENEDDSENED